MGGHTLASAPEMNLIKAALQRCRRWIAGEAKQGLHEHEHEHAQKKRPPTQIIFRHLTSRKRCLSEARSASADRAFILERNVGDSPKVWAKTKINLLLPQIGSRIIYQTRGEITIISHVAGGGEGVANYHFKQAEVPFDCPDVD